MSPTENSNQLFLPGGATNSQNSPYISVWPLHYYTIFFPEYITVYTVLSNEQQ